MTKYINNTLGNSILFSDIEWLNFLKAIQTGCKFYIRSPAGSSAVISGPSSYSDKFKKYREFSHHDVILKYYYCDSDKRNFLVSNDDRRKIVQYLREKNLIS